MGDDAATVEQLEAELRQARAEIDSLCEQLSRSNAERDEALEQQTATAEVLKVISRSAIDLQPVLDTLVENAARLCDAKQGFIFRPDGEVFRFAAAFGATPEWRAYLRQHPLRQGRGSGIGRAALERRIVHIPDVLADPDYELSDFQRRFGQRSVLSVPMVRDGSLVGVLSLNRIDVDPYSAREIALLETFADQAVIAIENARLFEELERRNAELQASNRQVSEALEQQTATADILRGIALSPTDAQPVIEAIAGTAGRLSNSTDAWLCIKEGDQLYYAAGYGVFSYSVHVGHRVTPAPNGVNRRVLQSRRTVHAWDTSDPTFRAAFPDAGYPEGIAFVNVPLVREDEAIGLLFVARNRSQPYTPREIALLETFADQAVIAIENARLFEELQESNRQVTEALEQQTATAEVLKVISRSVFDLQPVLDTLVDNATKLCGADQGYILRSDGEVFQWAADSGATAEFREFVQRNPVRQGRGAGLSRAALERRTVHIPDVLADPDYELHDHQRIGGYRTSLSVPLLRGGSLVGIFTLVRSRVEPFTAKQIELVETFADQAVIAIENVRLFSELQDRVEELQALGEVSQAVSSSLDLQEVLTTIVSHAVRLSGADAGTIYELDQGTATFSPRASDRMPAELLAAVEHERLRLSEDNLAGRAALLRQAQQSPDLLLGDRPAATLLTLKALQEAGFRALLAVPLVREQRVVGVLIIRRKTPGEFPQVVVDLVQTFASQSVLAIENARLFEQVQETSHQLAEASQHKSQFLANMSHELRTPLNAIIGYSEMLQEEAEDVEADAFLPDLQRINAAGKHLLGLINDILDLSKIEAGRMDLFLETFDVDQLVRDVEAIVQPLVEKNGNTLVVACQDDLGTIHADQTKLRQTLFNLLSNAAKFTERGTITLRVALTPRPPLPCEGEGENVLPSPAAGTSAQPMFAPRSGGVGGEGIVFAVTDTGIGMTEEQLGRLFEAFSQAEASTRSKYGGTGLGLAISRHFCRLMGGELTVTSVYCQGSTFTVRLPTAVAEPSASLTR